MCRGVGALLRPPQLRRRHREVHPFDQVLLHEDVSAGQGQVEERAGPAAAGWVDGCRSSQGNAARQRRMAAAASELEAQETAAAAAAAAGQWIYFKRQN